MDAEGHAAYFETGNAGYTYYDIDDETVAPNGYMVRSNFSFSGRENEGGGYLRYDQAEKSLLDGIKAGEVTPQWISRHLAHSFENPLMGIDLRSGILNKPNGTGWLMEQDFIARRLSSCSVVIQGVKSGDDPLRTVMWTSVGYPSVTPVIPLRVVGADKKLPRMVYEKTEKGVHSPLCDAANELRDSIYSYKRGNNVEGYFNWELLYNSAGSGFLQQTEAFEDKLFGETYINVDKLNEEEIAKLYDEVDTLIGGFYLRMVGKEFLF
jgi:hypothetical protein